MKTRNLNIKIVDVQTDNEDEFIDTVLALLDPIVSTHVLTLGWEDDILVWEDEA